MPDHKIKEKFTDPKTGEIVTRIEVPEIHLPDIEKNVNANAQHANNFMQISRNLVGMQKRQFEEWEKANQAEQDIGKEVIRIREKMGLDSSWIYNIPLKMMEKREAPEGSEILGEGVQK